MEGWDVNLRVGGFVGTFSFTVCLIFHATTKDSMLVAGLQPRSMTILLDELRGESLPYHPEPKHPQTHQSQIKLNYCNSFLLLLVRHLLLLAMRLFLVASKS